MRFSGGVMTPSPSRVMRESELKRMEVQMRWGAVSVCVLGVTIV